MNHESDMLTTKITTIPTTLFTSIYLRKTKNHHAIRIDLYPTTFHDSTQQLLLQGVSFLFFSNGIFSVSLEGTLPTWNCRVRQKPEIYFDQDHHPKIDVTPTLSPQETSTFSSQPWACGSGKNPRSPRSEIWRQIFPQRFSELNHFSPSKHLGPRWSRASYKWGVPMGPL